MELCHERFRPSKFGYRTVEFSTYVFRHEPFALKRVYRVSYLRNIASYYTSHFIVALRLRSSYPPTKQVWQVEINTS